MERTTLNSTKDLCHWTEKFINRLGTKDLILLSGPMGVGKSEFVKSCLKLWDVENTCSPTFAIHNIYTTSHKGVVDHIDLYRLESETDLESTGFWDIFEKPKGTVFIEWADRLKVNWSPQEWTVWNISLEFLNGDKRTLTLS